MSRVALRVLQRPQIPLWQEVLEAFCGVVYTLLNPIYAPRRG